MIDKTRKIFLPYQLRWQKDNSLIKIWEKSRRIGATFIQAHEDVADCVSGNVPAVWFSSADQSAAREYILYCEKWAKLYDQSAKQLGMVVLDPAKDVKAFVIEFSNGARINALSSNPKSFRSKGGKVVLDEFAHHEDQEAMWTAARPCITWGFPLRILSTHNGQNCRYFKFIDAVKKQKLQWSLHTTPIQLAVEEGLADKILKRKLTPEERDAWIEEQRESCFDEQTWQQEYCCIPVDEAEAFLTYDLIGSCRADGLEQPLDATTGYLYGGMDIGRKRDLSVIWVVERLGRALLTRTVRILEKTPFRDQRDVLFKILKHPRLRRFCIDSTGLGMQLAEEALEAFGRYRIEAVTFTGPVKADLAYGVKNMMEDRLLYIPDDPAITEDLHSVRKLTTSSGNVRFDVAYSDAGGHADRMWACALAVHAAADKTSGPIHVATRKRREAAGMFRGYD